MFGFDNVFEKDFILPFFFFFFFVLVRSIDRCLDAWIARDVGFRRIGGLLGGGKIW